MALNNGDPIGRAVYDYYLNSVNEPVIVHSEDFDDDEIDTSYMFRSYAKMPALEKKALKLCRGNILDVGACAGAHSVYLQNNGFEVTALEISELCCKVLEGRGVKQVLNQDIFKLVDRKFDTILLLMNVTGIAGTLAGLDVLLYQLKTLLNENGQILIDSSDLIFLYQEEDGSALIDVSSDKYYGEMTFQTEYKSWISEPFGWLYVDSENLEAAVEKNKLKIKEIFRGSHYDYLAQIVHCDE